MTGRPDSSTRFSRTVPNCGTTRNRAIPISALWEVGP